MVVSCCATTGHPPKKNFKIKVPRNVISSILRLSQHVIISHFMNLGGFTKTPEPR